MDTISRRIEEAHARSALYRYLSTLYVYPDSASWQTLHESSPGDLERVLSVLGWSAKGSTRLPERLQAMTAEQFASEHVAIFGHTAAGELRPYEAGYGAHHVFQETQCLADVCGFYGAFGLEPSETQRERPDHIAVELEFMHVLALKEAYALLHEWGENADLCTQAEIGFLRDHLGRWAPSFLKRLSDRSGGGIFELIADVTAACVKAHRQTVGVDLGANDVEPAPASAEPEGTNFSCVAACGAGMEESTGTEAAN